MNDKENSDIELSRLDNRSEEQVELIQKILKKIKPLDCEVVGNKTIRRIAEGRTFDPIEGGRHMSLIETISLLASIATFTQFAMVLYPLAKAKWEKEGLTTIKIGENDLTEENLNTKKSKQIFEDLIIEYINTKKPNETIISDRHYVDKILDQVISTKRQR